MNYIDTHLHLGAPEFREDLNEVISRAIASGVRYMITIGSGYGVENFAETLNLSEKYNLYFALGVHPHNADLGLSTKKLDSEYEVKLKSIFEEFRAYSHNSNMVGIGEIGLDFYYNYSPQDIQKETFYRFLMFASELDMPVIIHSRDAFLETIEIIKSLKSHIKGGVFHCFSGDIDQAREALNYGFYISIPGIVTFKKATVMRDVVRYIPSDRLLIETDAPFLAPVPFRGKRNEPAFIIETYKLVSEIRSISLKTLSDMVIKNAISCFRIKKGAIIDTAKG